VPRPPRAAVVIGFYVFVTTALLGILSQVFPLVLPAAAAGRIGHNSEGLLLALLLAAWIQFARPRMAGDRREWFVTGLVALGLLALGLWLLFTDLPSRFRTLNEPLLAAALLIPYVQLPRPLRSGVAGGASLAVLAATVVFNRTAVVTDLAEMLAALILVPIALDLVDRGVLDGAARTYRALRWTWYGVLVLTPVVLSVLQYQIGVSGMFGEGVRYGVRVTEAFLCVLFVEAFFAVGLGRTGRADSAQAVEAPQERAEVDS
jgi:hypothetical protein